MLTEILILYQSRQTATQILNIQNYLYPVSVRDITLEDHKRT